VKSSNPVSGYSGTPLAIKLGVKDSSVLALLSAPSGWQLELPPSIIVKRQVRGNADVAHVCRARRGVWYSLSSWSKACLRSSPPP